MQNPNCIFVQIKFGAQKVTKITTLPWQHHDKKAFQQLPWQLEAIQHGEPQFPSEGGLGL